MEALLLATQDDDCSENLRVLKISVNQGSESLSPFESLPCELVYSIIECVPESVFELRLTCRAFRRHVDSYARGPVPTHTPRTVRHRIQLRHSVLVPERLANLYQLRLNLRKPELLGRIRKYSHSNCEEKVVVYYGTEVLESDKCFPNKEDIDVWEYLVECSGMGTKPTDCPHLGESMGWNVVGSFDSEKVRIDIDELRPYAANVLLKELQAHNVDHLTLNVNRISLPEKFLLELSSVVRSLSIIDDFDHYCGRRLADITFASNRNLFGAHEVQWGPIILEMFTRRLDKLRIANTDPYIKRYLSTESADLLIKKLPHIGKKVWLEAANYQHFRGLSYKENNHIIHASRERRIIGYVFQCKLTIKHKSRQNGEF
ncbi:hypothetical protein PMAYCL1PPCAC_20000 [Pristionchus mayeri]|uniref:F-box domain-containing protein n=1 Tax=Pristionchus mayeri TaxID=1317129 RepID=A0AAN5CSL2_9BILA|nr:hypothetical protein PMAYCL1PPCAC_20000 [Pristionchus mayeri]